MSEAQPPQWASFRIWVLAALGAAVLHAGCAALALQYLRSDDDETLGAPAIEIGLEPAAPRREPDDLPPGPDADASMASPAVAEQKAVVEPSDLPKAVPRPRMSTRNAWLLSMIRNVLRTTPRSPPWRQRRQPGHRRRGDGGAWFSNHSGSSTLSHSGSRNRRHCAARASHVAEGVGRPFRQAQALSVRPFASKRRDPGEFRP